MISFQLRYDYVLIGYFGVRSFLINIGISGEKYLFMGGHVKTLNPQNGISHEGPMKRAPTFLAHTFH